MKRYSTLLWLSCLLGLALLSLTKPTSVTAKTTHSGYATTTQAINLGKSQLPKNTRVYVSGNSSVNHRTYTTIALENMSYRVRQLTTKNYLKVPSRQVKLLTIQPLALPDMLKGHGSTIHAAAVKAPLLRLTTDNYIEYFRHANDNQKPLSSTKITAIKTTGKLTHVYAKTNMLNLPDKHLRTYGNYRYRLAIKENQTDPDNLYMSYSVGHLKNYFYTPTLLD